MECRRMRKKKTTANEGKRGRGISLSLNEEEEEEKVRLEKDQKKKKSGMFSQDGSVCGGDITTTCLQWEENHASILRDRGIEEEYIV